MNTLFAVLYLLTILAAIGIFAWAYIKKFNRLFNNEAKRRGFPSYKSMNKIESKREKKYVRKLVKEKNKNFITGVKNTFDGDNDYEYEIGRTERRSRQSSRSTTSQKRPRQSSRSTTSQRTPRKNSDSRTTSRRRSSSAKVQRTDNSTRRRTDNNPRRNTNKRNSRNTYR